MRGWSPITHLLRLPAHADVEPTAGASLCLKFRFGPVANESAEWAVASFWAEGELQNHRGRTRSVCAPLLSEASEWRNCEKYKPSKI